MSAVVSSAQPLKLYRYSDVTTGLDRDLMSEANRLGDLLRYFESRCTEYPVRVSYLADHLRSYARTAEGVDLWVRAVGQGFEQADRGRAVAWGLRGQSVFSAQATAIIERLNPLKAFTQHWTLWLQFQKTDLALNIALWRIRYLIFRLQFAPWLDLVRLPWDLYERYQPLFAGALIASSIRFGHAYPGQIIINLPDFLRNFGFSLREIRTWAGLSGHLTHIKYTNLPSHMFWASLVLSIPSLVSRWSSDIIDYGSGEYTGTELASALTVDTALTLAPVATTYVGAKVGMIIGAAIGTMIAPGIGTAVGGAVGAIAGGVVAGWATKEVIERTDIREKAIPWLDEHVFGPPAHAIASGIGTVSGWVDEAARRLRQKLKDTVDAAGRVLRDEAIKPTSGKALELRQSLHNAMDGWGTDKDVIFSLLANASDADKQAVLNDKFLMDRLRSELSEKDMSELAKMLFIFPKVMTPESVAAKFEDFKRERPPRSDTVLWPTSGWQGPLASLMSYEPWSITENEKSLLEKLDPVNLAAFKSIYDRAMNMGDRDHNGVGDALRHAVWAALLTRKFGQDWARDYTNAHEQKPENPTAEEFMDRHNNALGIWIASQYPDLSEDELIKRIEETIRNGAGVYIPGPYNPSTAENGPVVPTSSQ